MFPLRDHNPSQKTPFVTWLIIALNAGVFFLELAAPDTEVFINNYALTPGTVHLSNPLSLLPFLTSMFLHGGWLHILSNMWFLWIFGDNIEAALGHFKYLGFYLVSGLVAAAVQFAVDPISSIPVLGASGAIAGVLGGYLVLFPNAKIETLVTTFGGFFTRVNVPASLMLIYWFITQLFSGVGTVAAGVTDQGGVAFFAHIGGFAAGWLIARLVKPTLDWVRIE